MPGHARCLQAEILALQILLAIGKQEHVATGGRGRGLAVVDENLAVALGEVDQHEAAPAQIPRTGVGDRQRETGGHRRVHHVAALLQDATADLGGQLLRAHYHAVAAPPWAGSAP